MRYFRMLSIVAVLLVAASSSGCFLWTWSYDFTASGASIEDWYYDGGDFVIDDDGIHLSHTTISTPVYFLGDITVEVTFNLDVDENHRARLEVGFGDVLWGGNDLFYIDLMCMGDPESERWQIWEMDLYNYSGYYEDGPIGPIIYDGDNVVKLEKRGDCFIFSLNGARMYKLPAKYADIEKAFVNIWSGYNQEASISIKKVEVKYNEISEPWPVVI